MALTIDGKRIETDAEGYLVDPSDWDEKIAVHLAELESLG